MTDERQRMNEMMETAKANLREHGELLPVLYVRGETELLVGLSVLPGDADGRGRLMEAVGRRTAHLRPTLVIAVMDAYIALPGEPPPTGSLADDPGAEECVIVASLDNDGRASVLVCPYERHPSLEGLEIEFGEVQEGFDDARLFTLEAYFRGVASGKERKHASPAHPGGAGTAQGRPGDSRGTKGPRRAEGDAGGRQG